jgi:eukaryotic-like serine/threonine-protein kinase
MIHGNGAVMLCKSCDTVNSEELSQCVSCGAELPNAEKTQTLFGATFDSGPGSRPSVDFSLTLLPGSDLGPRYGIERLLGEGGMGKVYLAQDRELNRKVALKLVRPELANDPRSLERLKQELLLASSISHKNILRIHDLGEATGVKYISMAYIEGSDLHDILEDAGKLPIKRALRMARQLVGALEAAHAENVVHRDLKPRNILVGKSDQIYVADFGLAKSLATDLSGMTHTGAIVGTPRYMSPEQVQGQAVDHRADLYAFGLILYEMVTGDVPFRGASSLERMYQRVKEKPKNPQVLNPEVPDYLAQIIMGCLEKEPERRYQNAGQILRDLDTGSAPARSSARRMQDFGRRRPVWLSVAALALVLALVVLGYRTITHRLPGKTGSATAVPSLASGKYVAVFPLRTLGEQEWLKYLAEGIVESLSAKLFQSKAVHLASPAAVEKTSRNTPLEKVAHDLGVNLVVQGSIRGEGEKIQLVISLEDIGSGQRVWTEEFSGLRQDVLTLEDQIYVKLIRALELKPSNEELAQSAMHPTDDIEAYDLYLKARSAVRALKQRKSVNGVNAALALYEQAIKKDRNFALAYAGMADACLYMYDAKKDSFWPEKALAAARQALQFNPNLPEVHFSLGSVYLTTGKTAEAIEELQRALQLAPNSDEGQRRLGSAYFAVGRKAEAFKAYDKAIQLNPYYWMNYNQLGLAYLQSGENERALNAFRRVTELEPDGASGYINVGVVYYREGNWKECVRAFEKAIALQPSFRGYSNLGAAYLNLGDYKQAVGVLEKAVAMSPNEQDAVGNLADAYRASGQREKAMSTYDRAIALGFKALQVNPRDANTLGNLALYYAKKKGTERAAEFIHHARSIAPQQGSLMYDEALVDALTGNRSEAVSMLRQAFQNGYPVEEAKNDPDLKDVRALPEFNKLVGEFSRKSK